jgi:hypothetical protein
MFLLVAVIVIRLQVSATDTDIITISMVSVVFYVCVIVLTAELISVSKRRNAPISFVNELRIEGSRAHR